MNPSSLSAGSTRPRLRGAPPGKPRSWRWAVLAALFLAAAILGGAFIAVAQAQEPEPPPRGSITGLSASSPEPGSLLVVWDLADPEPSDYRVVWHKVDEPFPTWRDADRNAYTPSESYTITDLEEDAEYRVLVRARYLEPAHRPPWSGRFAKTTARVSYGTPASPTGLAFSGVTHERLTLRWDAPRNSKVAGYEITRAVGDGPAQTLAADTGLSPETAYAYRVAARNDLGPGAASGPATVTTAGPALDPDLPRPTGLSVSFDDDGRVLLDWDDPEGDAVGAITGYRILRGPDAASLDLLVRDTASTATAWTDPSAPGGSTYFYAVRARDAGGMSEVSDPVAVSVLAAPEGLAGHGTAGGVGLTWDRTGDPTVDGYRILRGPDADSLDVLVDDTGNADNFYVDAAAAPETVYFYAVQARNTHGAGPVSAVVEALSPPLAPPTLVVDEPETAQQNSEDVLVSNLEQPVGEIIPGVPPNFVVDSSRTSAQSFGAGPVTAGSRYRFEGIKVRAARYNATIRPQPVVSLHIDANGNPGTRLFGLSPLDDFANTVTSTEYTLTAPEGTVLDGGATYWVVFTDRTADGYAIRGTTSSSEDDSPPPVDGWSIGNQRHHRTSGGSWSSGSSAVKIAVLGSLLPHQSLVSNLGQPAHISLQAAVGNIGVSGLEDVAYAVSFVTGPNADGYTLRGARVVATGHSLPTQGTVKAAVYSDNGGKPGSSLHTFGTLSAQAGGQAGVLTFTAGSPYTLDARTTYWLVMELDGATAATTLALELTASTSEDACAEWGWSIGNQGYTRGNSTSPWTSESSLVLKAAILGDTVSNACDAVHEPESGDLPADTTTTSRLAVDGPGARTILRGGKEGDEDWFRVELEAGVDYQFDQLVWIEGEAEPTPEQELYWAGNLFLPGDTEDFDGWNADFTLYDSNGVEVPGAVYQDKTHNFGGVSIKNRIVFRPAAAGVYYVGIEGNVNFNPDRVRVNAVLVRTDDYPADTTTTAAVEVGGLKENYLMVMSGAQRDVDWIRVSLEAGVKYQFTYYVRRCGHEAIIEGIYDSSGTLVDGTASSGKCWTTLWAFTPDTDGDYYVAVSGQGSHFPPASRYAFRGTTATLYVWSDTQGSSAEPEDGDLPEEDVFTRGQIARDDVPLGGRIDRAGDVDWFSVWVVKGGTYLIELDGAPAPGETNDLAGNLRLNIHRNLRGLGRGTTENDNPDVRAYAASDSSRVVHTYSSMHTGSRQPSYTGIHWLGVSAANDATGDYTIEVDRLDLDFALRGRRQVAQKLTADFDPSAISGVEYQWVRGAEGGAETDIPGADAATYTLADDDVGNRIKLRVAYDYQGFALSATSRATSLINTAPRVLVGNLSVPSQSADAKTTGLSQGFVTGSADYGYALNSVFFRPKIEGTARLRDFEFGLYTSTEHSTDTSRVVADRILTLEPPRSWSKADSRLTLFMDEAVKLERETTYHFGYYSAGGHETTCFNTNAGRDPNSLAGWSIIPIAWQLTAGGNTVIGFLSPCVIQIRGWEVLSPSFVKSMKITSSPGPDREYEAGEVIEVTVELSKPVAFVGPRPALPLQIGTATRNTRFSVADSTEDSWVFRYTVTDSDRDDDGISVESSALEVHADADLVHSAITNASGHVVNAAPYVKRTMVTSSPLAPPWYGPGETIRFEVTFTLPVTVTGDPELELNVTTPEGFERAMLESGSGTDTLVFAYVVQTADDDSDGIWWGADSIKLDADDAIRSLHFSRHADLSHSEPGKYGGHRIDQNPRLVSYRVTSDPQHGSNSDTYGAGDIITFELEYNQAVTVTSDPRLRFSITGPGDEYAGYDSGSGTRTLVFNYTVLATDSDTDGIYLFGTDLFDLDSDDAIRGADNSLEPVDPGSAPGVQSGHKIDGTIADQQDQPQKPPDTGGPRTTGSPRTGETLTATTDGIEDEDGLSSPGFSYQWVRHDPATGTDTDIDGETGAAYTVTDDDEGQALKVRVMFTDDAGNEESLTSHVLAVAPPLPPVEPESSFTASVIAKPDSHDGETAFTFELQLSEEPKEDFSYVTMRDHVFTVTGGAVTGARRLEPGSNVRWEISVTPDSNGGVTIVLPITENCDAQGAICTGDGRMLSTGLEITVSGPEASTSALTASVESAPASHDGSDAFSIRIALSEEPREGFSYVTMRDHAFTVTGGSVTGARRLDPPGNMRWEITVTPDSNGVVTIVLPVTEDCEADGAVCTDDGRMLSNRLEVTVPGPGG